MVKRIATKGVSILAKPTKRGKRKAEDSSDEAPVTKKVKAPQVGAGIKKPDLSKFKGLPLVLLREIFQYLSPDDLVNLCDAALIFWHALCRNSEAYIWKTCRENEGVYEIPDGMNEYFWAKLLFSSRCMECGVENVRLADFYLRRRICKECKRTKCTVDRYQRGLDPEAFEYSPVTHFTADGSRAAHNKVYWKADVVEQNQKLTALNLDVERGKPGATRALEEYKTSRRKLLRTIQAEVHDFTMYQDTYLAKKKKEEKIDAFTPRFEEIKDRFVKIGYSPKDFPPNMKMHKLVRSKTKLTERAWKNILEALEPEIQNRRAFRENKEWVLLKVSRRQALDRAYATHKFKNIPPTLWKYLPQTHTLCMFPSFGELITSDKNRELTNEDFASPLAQLDTILISAYEDTKVRLRELVVENADPRHLELSSTQQFQDLQLATVVFRCKHCSELIFGFEHVRTHHCANVDYALNEDRDERTSAYIDPNPFSNEFPFDCTVAEGAAQAVRMIVEVFGLDPKTATQGQMDEKNARLRCACSAGATHTARAYKWTHLVEHIFKDHANEVQEGTLKDAEIIPEEFMYEIRKKEAEDEADMLDHPLCVIACTHCDEYGRSDEMNWYTEDIGEHIQHRHGIQNPQVNVDFVDLTGKRISGLSRLGVDYHV